MTNLKSWHVHMRQRDGTWYYQCGDTFEHEARRWFDIYAKRYPDTPVRLVRGATVVEYANYEAIKQN
jgi:hypothetical protein